MGEIVNLRQARKAQRRATADREAEANRQAFGRTKAEKDHTASARATAEWQLDGHRRDDRA